MDKRALAVMAAKCKLLHTPAHFVNTTVKSHGYKRVVMSIWRRRAAILVDPR